MMTEEVTMAGYDNYQKLSETLYAIFEDNKWKIYITKEGEPKLFITVDELSHLYGDIWSVRVDGQEGNLSSVGKEIVISFR